MKKDKFVRQNQQVTKSPAFADLRRPRAFFKSQLPSASKEPGVVSNIVRVRCSCIYSSTTKTGSKRTDDYQVHGVVALWDSVGLEDYLCLCVGHMGHIENMIEQLVQLQTAVGMPSVNTQYLTHNQGFHRPVLLSRNIPNVLWAPETGRTRRRTSGIPLIPR